MAPPSPAAVATPLTATVDPVRPLTADDLVRLARRHPLTAVAAAEARASAAGVRAARAWANPEVEVEAGRAQARAADGEDANVGRIALRQPIAWPRERARRVNAALAAGAAGEAAAALPLLDLDARIRATALELTFARRARAGTEAALSATRAVLATVARRAAAGEASRGDALRVEIEVVRSEQDLADHDRDADAALARLNTLCGGGLPRDVLLGDDVAAPARPDPARVGAEHPAGHPHLAHLVSIVRQRQAEAAQQRAVAAPGFSVGVYGAREADVDDVGVTLGVELPLWDRNQGGKAVASAALARARADVALAQAEIALAAADAAATAAKAADRARRYREAILPKAREALRLALATYAGNESSLLDLLDALRTAHAIDAEALAAERDAGLAVIAWRQALGITISGDTP